MREVEIDINSGKLKVNSLQGKPKKIFDEKIA